jgi:archaeosine synthase beta-subunit
MEFSFVDKIYDPLLKKTVNRWVLELPGAGCEWHKKSGGCTMCAFNQSTQKYTFGGKLYPHFIFMLIFYYAYLMIRHKKPEQLVIYNGGSFLCDNEIPRKTQLAILRFVQRHSTINKIMVESRANYVTTQKMGEYTEAIGHKDLQIAIGLESSDDKVRNGCLKKGMSKATFELAVALCQEFNFQTFAYVFLKPHCLNEKEAVADAISSIKYCFDVCVDEVSLSCAFVQKGTLLYDMYKDREFTPPTLWSIMEVIIKTAEFGPVRIGNFDDDPTPIAFPHNCWQCNDTVISAIENYRQTHDISSFDGLFCGCQSQN